MSQLQQFFKEENEKLRQSKAQLVKSHEEQKRAIELKDKVIKDLEHRYAELDTNHQSILKNEEVKQQAEEQKRKANKFMADKDPVDSKITFSKESEISFLNH